jgi:hypothetical protein
MDFITIKTFSDKFEALLDKSKLESEGIFCFLKNETLLDTNPLLSVAFGNYQLQCKKEDTQKALDILKTIS